MIKWLLSRPKRQALIFGILLVIIFGVAPLYVNAGLQFQISILIIFAIFAQSFNLVNLSGSTSFGHAAFFAAGAYTTGFLLQRHPELPFLITLMAGGVAGAVLAFLVGVISLRRVSGIYFAILTLALAQLFHIFLSTFPDLGRQDGLTGIKRPIINLYLIKIDLSSGNALYYFILICGIILIFIFWLIWNSEFGRVLSIIRQDSERARFLGINIHRVRLFVFSLSGAGSAVAGGLYAPLAQLLTPDLAHWSFSGLPLLYCLLGGRTYFWGPTVGAIFFIGISYQTKDMIGISEIVSSVILLIIILGFPGGILGSLYRFINRKR